jgi:hypothetical protein
MCAQHEMHDQYDIKINQKLVSQWTRNYNNLLPLLAVSCTKPQAH